MESKVDVAPMTPRDCYEYLRTLGLGTRRRDRRTRAEAAIRATGPDSVPLLVQGLAWETGQRKRNMLHTLVLGAAVSLAIIPLPIIAPDLWHHDAFQIAANTISAAIFLSTMLWAFPTRQSRRATALLQEWQDIRALEPLMDMVEFASRTTKPELRDTIIRTLRSVTAENAGELGETARKNLLQLIKAANIGVASYDREQREYIIEVMRVLATAGEVRALPVMRKLATDESLHGAGLWARNAARDALPILERAAEVHRISGTLLRPTVSLGSADVLVRPANAAGDDSAALLVRPVGQRDKPD